MRSLRASPQRSARLVAAALCVTMLGTTLPTPLYALYRRSWGFSTFTGTVVFSAYALGVIAALLLLGRSSDVIGRKPVLLLGAGCAAASDLVFLGAHDVGVLVVARLLSGASAGIFTGTATAALVDLASTAARGRATLLATVANMGGLALGPMVAGLLAWLAPEPLLMPYVVHLGLVALAVLGLRTVPETVPETAAGSGHRRVPPPRLGVPLPMRGVFVRVALPGFAGFGLLGLFAAVVPTYAQHLLRLSDSAPAGAVASVVFVASCLGQVALVGPLGSAALSAGRAALVLGLGLLALALATESFPLLLAAAVVAGLGQGLTFRVGLAQLNERAPEAARSQVASTFFAAMYAGISLPVMGVGLATDLWGLRAAGFLFSPAMAVLCLIPVSRVPAGAHKPATRPPTDHQPSTRCGCHQPSEVAP